MDTTPSEHHAFWNDFYGDPISGYVPTGPSSFARKVHERVAPERSIVDVGFGNARDAFWFAGHGRQVMGLDFAESAVERARALASRGVGESSISFERLNLYEADAPTKAKEAIATRFSSLDLYARFLIHSLEDKGRHHLLDLAAMVLGNGGELHLEFRTTRDQRTAHVFGEDHFRRLLDVSQVAAEIEERCGTVVEVESGFGLAIHKDEDPHIARITARWGDG